MAGIKVDVNLGKTQQKMVLYNLKALEQIFKEELGIKLHGDGTSDCTKDESTKKSPEKEEDKSEWRRLPDSMHSKECLIVCSGGECPESVVFVPKQRDNSLVDSDPLLLRQELDIVQEKMWQDNDYHLVQVCTDYPGVQMGRDYYLEKVKQVLVGCKQAGGEFSTSLDHTWLIQSSFVLVPINFASAQFMLCFHFIALIWYTGHGEKATGNWCFKDGVISFEDLFALYMDHFRGKVLTLVCDCSYSGRWVEQCAKKLDEIGIPSCGHHTRDQGILIKVYCSCKSDQKSEMLVFCNEGVFTESGILWYRSDKQLTAGQQAFGANFCIIRCRKKPEETCEVLPHHTWMERLFLGPYVYLVRGKDKDKPAWYYVLVDKEKEDDFKAKVATGTIDVADYGKIICSGWGENPPAEKKKWVGDRFHKILEPE